MAKKSRQPQPQGETVTAMPVVPVAAPPKLIMVRSPNGAPFWERHPDHPKGEAWVAGNNAQPGPAVQVARTAAVDRALREGRLEIADSR